jgi:predicted aldo/keto reductase-like oxidoreductase
MSQEDDKKLSRRDLFQRATATALVAGALGPTKALAADPLPQVPRRVLGKTGQKIPILLFGGSMRLDQRFDPKIAEAMRFGVNYMDAADCYGGGTCESAVGAYHTMAKNRADLWITTKSDDHDPAGFEKVLETSLKKLKTDHVELYFLHGLDDPAFLTPELFKVVEKLKKEKKIGHFGFSCHAGNVAELMQKAAGISAIDAIMFRYNFRQYGNKELNTAMDACRKSNIGLIAMKTQSSESSFADAVKKFESSGKWNKYQAVLKAVWADERITAAVSHMDNIEKLRENIAAALDKTKLGQHEIEALEKYARDTRAFACDGCDHHCNPAVDAPVKIGATMRALMYHDGYQEPEKARELWTSLPERARQLRLIDFSRANAACPHGIDVALHMKRAAELFEPSSLS